MRLQNQKLKMANSICFSGAASPIGPTHHHMRNGRVHSKKHGPGYDSAISSQQHIALCSLRSQIGGQSRSNSITGVRLLSSPLKSQQKWTNPLHSPSKQSPNRLFQPPLSPSHSNTTAIKANNNVSLSAERLRSEPGTETNAETNTEAGLETDTNVHGEANNPSQEPFADYIAEAVRNLRPQFEGVDQTVAVNLRRVLDAYREARVGSHHLTGSTGYGHNDAGGREALDK